LARGSVLRGVEVRGPISGVGNRYMSFASAQMFEDFGRENVLLTMYDELRADPKNIWTR